MNTSFVRTTRWTPKQRHASILSLLICACLPVVSSAQNLIGAQALADPSPPQISEYVREVFQDRDGDFWFGTNGDGVCRFDGKSLTYLSVKDGFGGVAVRGILQDEDGTMWFATNGGVSRYESGVFTNYTAAHGLSADSVWSMMLDSAGTIWVGTHEGVCRFDGESFGPFPLPKVAVENPESRFSPKVVFAMFEDQTGDLWFGTDGEGAHRYDGDSFTSYTMKDGLAGDLVRCIRGDRLGRIWIGTDGGGVSCFDGTAFRTFTTADGLSNDRIFEILEDSSGNMWFSTLGAGACRYDGTSFTAFREDPGLILYGRPARAHVQEFLEDKDGVLWLGCSGGLFRLDGESFVNVTRNGPWPNSPSQPDDPQDGTTPRPGY
jgi:streptogramin lyase